MTKPTLHKIYLILSIIVITYGIWANLWNGEYFRYPSLRMFTYQSNLLVVATFIALLLTDGSSTFMRYLSSSTILAIAITGLVYNLVLVPFAGNPPVTTGFPNFSTHLLAPILGVAHYFIFMEKGHINFKHVLVGMIFPATYWVIFVSIGRMINFHPYFFMDPTRVGWVMIFVWLAILLGSFFVFGTLLFLYDRRAKKY